MMRMTIGMFAATLCFAQSAANPDLLRLTDELQAEIQARNWTRAAELSHLISVSVRDARNQSMTGESAKLVDKILDWVPSDTETLVVAQEPFLVSESKPSDSQPALLIAQAYVLGLLGAAEGEQLEKALMGRTVRVAALAARNFAERPPDAKGIIPLGVIAYQACAVYAFAQPLPEPLIARHADETVLGQQVWISRGTQNDPNDTDTYFVSRPAPDTMLACNDRSFLGEMITRMAGPGGLRALPSSLPEWKYLDRSAPLWAIRHYRADRARVDPSQPAHLLAANKDPDASGVVVHFGLASFAAKAIMLSRLDAWNGVENATEFQGAAKSSNLADGLWALTVADKPEAAAGMAVFVLMGVLGFAVNL